MTEENPHPEAVKQFVKNETPTAILILVIVFSVIASFILGFIVKTQLLTWSAGGNSPKAEKVHVSEGNGTVSTDIDGSTSVGSDTSSESNTILGKYSFDFPSGWILGDKENKYLTVKVPLHQTPKVDQRGVDANGYPQDGYTEVVVEYVPATDILKKVDFVSLEPSDYAALVAIALDTGWSDTALTFLSHGVFNVKKYTTTSYLYRGVSRIVYTGQDGFFPSYELLLFDAQSGDVIRIYIRLEGREIDQIRQDFVGGDQTRPYTTGTQKIESLLEKNNRDQLDFGYLLDALDTFVGTMNGVGERASEKG